ncbi:PepSY domain-containing protein [Maricaulis parjimensis]|uniref:PepSY domain-containing protein n=1 Tax=Maricaulis parjimensis TaxID=144023 RepID=UPI0019397046|nr:PepSY domain-containing protein [Maricaulis parjimensis]
MLRHLIIIAGAFCAFAVPAAADAMMADSATAMQTRDPRDRYTPSEARDARRQGDVVPALRVISTVRQRYPGADVLDAELEGGASPRYVIKILTRDGRRVDVVADARTGQILYER